MFFSAKLSILCSYMTVIQRTLNFFSIEISIQNGLYHDMHRFKIDQFKVESSVLKGFDLNMMHMKSLPLITFFNT